MAARQKITPCLWFDGNAEAAVGPYVSIFPDSGSCRCLPRNIAPTVIASERRERSKRP